MKLIKHLTSIFFYGCFFFICFTNFTNATKFTGLSKFYKTLKPFIRRMAPEFDETSIAKCLDRHQYPLWRLMMNDNGACEGVIEGFGNLDLDNVPKGSGMMEMVLGALKTRSGAKQVCNLLNTNALPCVYRVAPEIVKLFTDKECFNPAIAASNFDIKDVYGFFDSINGLLCGENEEKNDLCVRVLLKNLGQNFNEKDVLISKFLKTLQNCPSTLGCCGAQIYNLDQFFKNRLDISSFHNLVPLGLKILDDATCKAKPICKAPEGKPDYPKTREIGNDLPPLVEPVAKQYEDFEPQQIHISLGEENEKGIAQGMAIMWVTSNFTKSIVQYGETEKLGEELMNSNPPTIYNDVESQFYLESTYNHLVRLENLKSNTKYYYTVGDDKHRSSIFSFTTAPETNDEISMALVGDMGLYESEDTMKLMTKLKDEVGLFFHIGDISYADNWILHNLVTFGYEYLWNLYMNSVQAFAAYTPYMVCPGNHEAECHEIFGCNKEKVLTKALSNYTAYNHRFAMPSKNSKGSTNMWYSFNYGPVHFVSISTETDFKNAPLNNFTSGPAGNFGDQTSWLRNDLKIANKNRQERPWIVVLGHRPIYDVGSQKHGKPQNGAKIIQDWLEEMFNEFKVDIYFAGHVHNYERHYPIYDGTVYKEGASKNVYQNPKKTTYIIHGHAGNEELHSHDPRKHGHSYPDWAVHTDFKTYGVGLMHADKNKITWEYKSVYTGESLDTFSISKGKGNSSPGKPLSSDSSNISVLSITTVLICLISFLIQLY